MNQLTTGGPETANLIDGLTAARSEVFAALRSVPRDRFTSPPADGGWSVRQVCEHLADNENFFVPQVASVLDVDVWSSGRAQLPSPEEAVSALVDSREMLLWALQDVTDEELSALHSHPRVGDFTIRAVLEQLITHDHDHAAQVRSAVSLSGLDPASHPGNRS